MIERMWLQSLVFLCLTANYIFAQYPGDSCTVLKDKSNGTCKLILECETALNEIKVNRHHSHFRCGFEDFTEVVCCADLARKFGGDDIKLKNAREIAESECEKLELFLVPHIIGGVEATLGEIPHSAALGYKKGDGTYKFDCGGTIISQSFVLTAGHCAYTAEKDVPAIVRTGITDLGPNTYQPETDSIVAEVIKHPNYTRSSKYNDITLLKLQQPLTFSRNVNAACLETNTEVSRTLQVSGWGVISNTKYVTSSVLLKTSVNPVPSKDCKSHYKQLRKMTEEIVDGQFCAGDDKGGHDTCQGDSGGPATTTNAEGKYKVVGVTSFGRGCGSTIPAIYTRVAHYIDWIVGHVWASQLRNK